jgi:hypothetical protein
MSSVVISLRSAKFHHFFAPHPLAALQAAMSVWRFVKELMQTDFGLFFARLLNAEQLQKCVIFGDGSRYRQGSRRQPLSDSGDSFLSPERLSQSIQFWFTSYVSDW